MEPQDRWQLNSWFVNNSDPEPSPARFVVRGVSDHTVRPSIFCPSTGEGLWFNGVVPERSTLVIDRDGRIVATQRGESINALWVVASFGILIGGLVAPNLLGAGFVVVQAVAVAAFAALQLDARVGHIARVAILPRRVGPKHMTEPPPS